MAALRINIEFKLCINNCMLTTICAHSAAWLSHANYQVVCRYLLLLANNATDNNDGRQSWFYLEHCRLKCSNHPNSDSKHPNSDSQINGMQHLTTQMFSRLALKYEQYFD